jgi:hypothetical protein
MFAHLQHGFSRALHSRYFYRSTKRNNTLQPARRDTAILLFSRSAEEESVAKPLTTRSGTAQQAVATHLIKHARSVARHSGFPVFCIGAHQHDGRSFGERYADAFEQLFARGFDRVISIGNDCPSLTSADLVAAAAQLDQHACVFGPASDGGAYLVGMRREAYKRTFFVAIAWQTPCVFTSLTAFAAGDFGKLPEKADVDTPADLLVVLHQGRLLFTLQHWLILCLQWRQAERPSMVMVIPEQVFAACHALRGPPQFS